MKRVFLLFHLAALIPLDNTLTLQVERGKRQTTCPSGSRLCRSGECFSSNDICDGVKNCADGSDETRETCREVDYDCPSYLFKCDYGACIEKNKVCNQIEDCVDGSDEKNCLNSTNSVAKTSQEICKEDPHKFPCKNKECINSNLICDGDINCSDKSDETKEICGTFVCPSFLFQCDYGGCIEKNRLCNGVNDCVDGSDESSRCTDGIYMNTTTTPSPTRPSKHCRNSEYKCKNNECINKELICDGGKDCSDGSDETKELCKTPCPGNSFTCDYGGCINRGLRCNGVSDCVDGSDEFSRLCDTPTSTSTSRPPTTPTPSPLIPVTQGGRPCQHPRNPPNGIIENVCKSCVNVNHYGGISLKCNAGYTPENAAYAYCVDSRITASLTCKPIYCPSVESLSTIATCYHNGNKLDSCKQENLIPDTTVNYRCRYGYQLNDQPIEYQNSKCFLRGEKEAVWHPEIFHCVSECGLGTPRGGTGFIVDGKPAIPIEHPWHCGVFKNKNNLFEQICGGTLVSRYFVLSAAHCFTEPNKPELYRVIFGKIHRSYGIHDQTQREYQIQKIINNEYFTEDVFEDDIAFIVLKQEVQLSATIMPACIDFHRKHFDLLLSAGSKGQVAGWGLTNNDKPSPILQYTDLEYHNFKECRDKASEHYKKFNTPRKFCAGTIGGSAVCPGDSGGGLLFNATEGPPNWYLMGIVSTGVVFENNSCVRTQYPVFTSIRNQLEFINKEFNLNAKLTFKGV